MASLDTLIAFEPHSYTPATTNPATLDLTALPSFVLDFDDATDETAYFSGIMPGQYDGTSALEVVLHWKFSTHQTGTGTCAWEVAFYRVADDVDTYESAAGIGTPQGTAATATEASAAGELDYYVLDFTNAQANGIQPNERFVLRVVRDASRGTQGSPGDAELAGIEVRLD